MTTAPERLPVSVLTGFLGSGKSTVLGRLLVHPAMAETAVIVNEFGEIGIDHALIAQSDEDTVLMNSGCLCCTIRGDLVRTLGELMARRQRGEVSRFQRVVVETTGLADPAPILHTLMADATLLNHFRLDGVIATVDAVNGAGTLDGHSESIKQAAVADRLLITKTDLAEPQAIDALAERLHKINPAASLHHVRHGEIAPDRLFDAGLYNPATKTADAQKWLNEQAYGDDHGHHHGHDPNRHDDAIRAFCLTFDQPFEWESLSYWLELLATYRGDDLLRVKGLFDVNGIDRPVVVHGVQHVFHPPATIDHWPDGDQRSRVVFITRNLDHDTIRQTLAGVNDAAAAPGDPNR